jgi:hypothetical protein
LHRTALNLAGFCCRLSQEVALPTCVDIAGKGIVPARAPHSPLAAGAAFMEFVDAVRLVYNLASGMELTVDEGAPRDLQRQAQCESEALDLICEWLSRQGTR